MSGVYGCCETRLESTCLTSRENPTVAPSRESDCGSVGARSTASVAVARSAESTLRPGDCALRKCTLNVRSTVDCSAAEDVYNEQYAAFHLAKGGPTIVTSQVTLTRSTMIKF